jgi:hypothetical protein
VAASGITHDTPPPPSLSLYTDLFLCKIAVQSYWSRLTPSVISVQGPSSFVSDTRSSLDLTLVATGVSKSTGTLQCGLDLKTAHCSDRTLKFALFPSNELKNATKTQVKKTFVLLAFYRINREFPSGERAMRRARVAQKPCNEAKRHSARMSASTTIHCLYCCQASMWVLGSWRDRIFTESARAHAGLPMLE